MFNEPLRDFSEAAERRAVCRERWPRSNVPEVAAVGADACPAGHRHGRRRLSRLARSPTRWSARRSSFEAAAAMRGRRDELAAMMIREAGKTWREADADVCEAIDFCEYYARVAVGLFQPQRLGRFVGELNHQWYQPRGVAAIISPWNFPLAICCRHDHGRAGHGQHGRRQAVDADPRHRPGDVRNPLAGGRARRRAALPARRGPRGRATCWSATRAWP